MNVTVGVASLLGRRSVEISHDPQTGEPAAKLQRTATMGSCLCRQKGTTDEPNEDRRRTNGTSSGSSNARAASTRATVASTSSTSRTQIDIHPPNSLSRTSTNCNPSRQPTSAAATSQPWVSRNNFKHKNSSVDIDALILETLALIRTLVDK